MDSSKQIPEEDFSEILEELKRKPLDINKYRDSAGIGRSQAFGVVNKRCLPPDYSRQNWLRPKLLFHLMAFAEKHVPIAWNAITVNQNYRADPHKDKHNTGSSFLVAFGDFTGGELEFHEGPRLGLHNIRHNPVIENFSAYTHSVKDFQGERYSLVFYQFWTSRLPDLPPFSVRIEDGQYYFYRGDEKITKENGLPHPLRKVKTK